MHFLLNVPGFGPLITHLFEEGAEYLDSDVVFGTKQELVVGYEHHDPGPDTRRRHERRAVGVGHVRLRAAADVMRAVGSCTRPANRPPSSTEPSPKPVRARSWCG